MAQSIRYGAVLLFALCVPLAAAGQTVCRYAGDEECPGEVETAPWRVDARIGIINAALGAVSVAGLTLIRGETVDWRDVAMGALGGAVVFGGKRLAAEPFSGAGFLGRQVAAFGGAAIQNAGSGLPPLERITFGLGPAQLTFSRGDRPVLSVDVATVAAGIYFMTAEGGGEIDWRRSLSSGAFVIAGRDEAYRGRHAAGAIRLPGRMEIYDENLLLRHEAIHVIQSDQIHYSATTDLDAWIANAILPDAWAEHVTLGLDLFVTAGTGLLFHYSDRPWEIEAYHLTRQWR